MNENQSKNETANVSLVSENSLKEEKGIEETAAVEPLSEEKSFVEEVGLSSDDERIIDAEIICAASESERSVLLDIKDGLKRKYKIFAWTLDGELNMENYKNAYNELFCKDSSLRTRFISDGVNMPIRVVEKNKSRIFRLMDLRTTPHEGQEVFVKNAILSMSRENYKPDTDLPIKLHVYMLRNKTIQVVLGMYTHLGLSVSADDVRRNVFRSLRMDSETPMQFIEEEKSEQIVAENNSRCFKYWKKEIGPIGRHCMVPFAEKKKSPISADNYVIEHEVTMDINSKLCRVTKENGLNYESIILFCFSKLIREYNETESPLLFIRDALSMLTVKPIKINGNLDKNKCIEDIYRQMEYGKNFTDCAFGDFCDVFDLDKRVNFEILFDFVNEDENEKNTKTENALRKLNARNSIEFLPRLEIDAIFSKKANALKIRYSYEADGITEDTIEMIHDSFIQALKELILETDKFDWQKYISEYRDDKEKLHKLNVAQKAIYIKDGDFLAVKDPRDVLMLAECGKVGAYMTEDYVYNEGTEIDYLGILVAGHLEERYVGTDGITRTLSVYKKGYMIGLEALTDEPKSDYSYVATENGVRIMWIPVSDLMRVLNRDSASFCKLLKKSLNETKRIKKLWSLE